MISILKKTLSSLAIDLAIHIIYEPHFIYEHMLSLVTSRDGSRT